MCNKHFGRNAFLLHDSSLFKACQIFCKPEEAERLFSWRSVLKVSSERAKAKLTFLMLLLSILQDDVTDRDTDRRDIKNYLFFTNALASQPDGMIYFITLFSDLRLSLLLYIDLEVGTHKTDVQYLYELPLLVMPTVTVSL